MLETLERAFWPGPAEVWELDVTTDITLAYASRAFVFS